MKNKETIYDYLGNVYSSHVLYMKGVDEMQSQDRIRYYYDLYHNMVFRIAILYMKNKADAYNIVQEIFIKMINHKEDMNILVHTNKTPIYTIVLRRHIGVLLSNSHFCESFL